MDFNLNELSDAISSGNLSYLSGADKQAINSCLDTINKASCSSCVLRRNIHKITTILDKYGHSISHNTGNTIVFVNGAPDILMESSGIPVLTTQNIPERRHSGGILPAPSRIPCPDCTIKHTCQAYALSFEYTIGNNNVIWAILAHLYEALDECPPDNKQASEALQWAINETLANLKPTMPVSIILDSLKSTVTAVNIDKKLSTLPKGLLGMCLGTLSDNDLALSHRILGRLQKENLTSSENGVALWYGSLACVSDILSRYSPQCSQWLRERRIYYFDAIKNGDNVSSEVTLCDDVYALTTKITKQRGIY